MGLVNPSLFGEVTIQRRRKVEIGCQLRILDIINRSKAIQKEGKGLGKKPFLYRPRTVAQRLDISIRQVYNLVKEGQLIAHSHHESRRGLLINADSVEEFIKRTRIQPQKWLE